MCNFRRPNDLYGAAQASGKNPLTSSSIAAIPLTRLIHKGHQKDLTQLFTSFKSIACNARASQPKPNLLQSIASYFRHPPPATSSRCCCVRRRLYVRQKSECQPCTTNQQKSHVGIRTVTTKAAPPNCSCNRQQGKTYSRHIDTSTSSKNRQNHSSSYDDNHDCINHNNSNSNHIDTNKSGWYIQLASNCYRNGFQLHVNHLDEWSKHPCLVQRKPIQVLSVLRLPSSALQPASQTDSVSSKKPVRLLPDQATTISTLCDFIAETEQQPIRVACEQINLNCNKNHNVLNDCNGGKKHRVLKNDGVDDETDDIKRIYVRNSLEPSDTQQHLNRSIDDSSKLPVIDTERIVSSQQHHRQQQVQHIDDNKIQQQFDTPNAKNTMNSGRIAIDAHSIHLEQQTANRQSSCQAIQNNYRNNNFTFDREFHAGAQQSVPPPPPTPPSLRTPHTLANEDSSINAAVAHATAIAFTVATNIADNATAPSATIFNNTHTTNENNNQQQQHYHPHHHHNHHWLNENNSNAIVSTANPPQSIGTRPTATNHIDDIVIDDLIESFNTKFDVIDPTQRRTLPQIVLSDFSNNQLSLTSSSSSPLPSPALSVSLPSPSSTIPLAFAIQSTHTLSEHPDQLQELQHFYY